MFDGSSAVPVPHTPGERPSYPGPSAGTTIV
jgi:hypothetical protein